ncbi:hypothetical protein QBC43DRAFT_370591 [Cladorrhinum sp. PSN259]|nr:hypothetical protein QBC43DRAFT_370591 [Cladorrhinum sp. PSN259]
MVAKYRSLRRWAFDSDSEDEAPKKLGHHNNKRTRGSDSSDTITGGYSCDDASSVQAVFPHKRQRCSSVTDSVNLGQETIADDKSVPNGVSSITKTARSTSEASNKSNNTLSNPDSRRKNRNALVGYISIRDDLLPLHDLSPSPDSNLNQQAVSADNEALSTDPSSDEVSDSEAEAAGCDCEEDILLASSDESDAHDEIPESSPSFPDVSPSVQVAKENSNPSSPNVSQSAPVATQINSSNNNSNNSRNNISNPGWSSVLSARIRTIAASSAAKEYIEDSQPPIHIDREIVKNMLASTAFLERYGDVKSIDPREIGINCVGHLFLPLVDAVYKQDLREEFTQLSDALRKEKQQHSILRELNPLLESFTSKYGSDPQYEMQGAVLALTQPATHTVHNGPPVKSIQDKLALLLRRAQDEEKQLRCLLNDIIVVRQDLLDTGSVSIKRWKRMESEVSRRWLYFGSWWENLLRAGWDGGNETKTKEVVAKLEQLIEFAVPRLGLVSAIGKAAEKAVGRLNKLG